MNGVVVDLKNYDRTKYSSFGSIAKQFVSQASKYCQYIGTTIDDQIIRGVTFFFSSKPPQEIIDALQQIGVGVEWVR